MSVDQRSTKPARTLSQHGLRCSMSLTWLYSFCDYLSSRGAATHSAGCSFVKPLLPPKSATSREIRWKKFKL